MFPRFMIWVPLFLFLAISHYNAPAQSASGMAVRIAGRTFPDNKKIYDRAVTEVAISRSVFKKRLELHQIRCDQTNISRVKVDELEVSRLNSYFFYESDVRHTGRAEYTDLVFRQASYRSDSFDALGIRVVKGNYLSFEHCTFLKAAELHNLQVDTISLNDCDIGAGLRIAFSPEVRYLNIEDVRCPEPIDLSDIALPAGSECLLLIKNTDLSRVKLNYINFRLPDTMDLPQSSILSIYERLLRTQKENGFTDGYEKLDIEYRDYKLRIKDDLQERFSRAWWRYGYDKGLIFTWTGWGFVVSFLMYFLLFNPFITQVYVLDNIRARWRVEQPRPWWRRWRMRLWLSIMYTCIIFFGLKLEIDKLKMKYLPLVFLLYLSYMFGIVCLVFIGNYFLLRS